MKVNFTSLFKKYGYFALAGLLVAVLGIMSIVINTENEDNTLKSSVAKNPIVSVQSSAQTISFSLPMENPTVLYNFSNTEFYWNKTFSWYEAHEAMDLVSENLDVFAVADGVVSSVTSDSQDGAKIMITHKTGLVSVYASLSDVTLKLGDTVKKGQKIGKASTSAGNEFGDGAHLHFEMVEDGKKIDPNSYLDFEIK